MISAEGHVLLLVQLACSLFMMGLIWFVQLVHYPLMKFVDSTRFADFSQAHQHRTTWVVAVPMLVELAAAVGLLLSSPWKRQSVPYLASLALLAVIWIATVARQMPLHRQLLCGYDAACIQRLVTSNWVRTISWSLRSILLGWLLRGS